MPVALDGLNRAQEAAVAHADGPLVVVAGAGTGKTHTLVHRFAWLVDQGVPAEQILALTFSPPAAADLRERLEALLDSPYEELHVETFRSFALRLLQDEALEAGVDPFLIARYARPTGSRCCSSGSTTSRSAPTRSAATPRRCSPASCRASTG